ncbi:2og-Fe oxygenase family protein [Apiospora saccharicola]|uniref:2og-Fe oxygenase family protein n=1 Tax=Apiospora saccharicola TaxID=335842 RepID=A0ABR1TLE3_9PEZI
MPEPSPRFEVPTVDIGPYLRDASSDAAADVVEAIKEACTGSGFFQVVNHGISRELQNSIQQAAQAFFALPREEKTKLIHPTLTNRGYEMIGSQVLQADALPDLKEGFCIGQHMEFGDARVQEHPHLMGPNMFPAILEEHVLKTPAQQYYTELFNLAYRIMEMLARGLPYGDDIFVPFMSNDPVCILRLLHYPPQTSPDKRQLGAGAHTDFGAITLLWQDSCGGLEVQDGRTGEWYPVEPNPEALVVNIGDMLSVWTNVYRNTVHRVINSRGNQGRYSMAFFVDGNTDVKLAPLDGSVPATGKIMTTEEHMEYRIGKTYRRVAVQAA